MNDKAQLYTLEGIFAGLIILAGLLFAIQATTTSPGAAGGPDLSATHGDRTLAQDVLQSADHETLREAVMYWSQSGDGFHCSPSSISIYPGDTAIADNGNAGECNEDTSDGVPSPEVANQDSLPPNDFGRHLDRHLGTQYTYNVRVGYHTGPDTVVYQRMVYQGEPGSGAVRARRAISITNSQPYYNVDGTQSSTTLADDKSSFYAPPMDGDASDDNLYNVVYVEVIVWRP